MLLVLCLPWITTSGQELGPRTAGVVVGVCAEGESEASESEQAMLTGIQHFYNEEIEEALSYLSRSIQLDPDYLETYLVRGICHLKLGAVAKAKADFDFYLEGETEQCESNNCIGKLLYVYGFYEQAEQYFQAALSHDPENAAVYSNLGSIMVELGRMTEAKDCFVQAVALDPELSEAHLNLGMLYFIIQDFSAAEQSFLQAVELNQEKGIYDSTAYANLGDLYYAVGEMDACVKAYSIALNLDPELQTIRTRYGIALLERGEQNQAQEQFEEVIAQGNAPAEAHARMAAILRRKGMVFEAISEYRKAIQISGSQDVEATLALAEIFTHMERNREALALYTQAFDLGFRTPLVLSRLSSLSEKNGKTEQAIFFFKYLSAGDHDDLSLLYEVARRCVESRIEAIRDPVKALEISRRLAMLLGEGHPGVLCVMAEGYAELGDYRQAAEAQSEIIESMSNENPLVPGLTSRLQEYLTMRH